jgi:urea transport system ATP-binding protein
MMLSINNINQFYGGSHILWDVAFSVPTGSCTVLMGRNGMGKSTLLRCLMGLTPVASGSATWNGTELIGRPASDRVRMRIGYVPQGREIFSQLSVEENLRTGLGARHDRVRQVPSHIYEMFPVLRDMAHRRGGDLSGGQQQQLAIGRALVTDPTLLVLDEPTEGIQPNIVHEIGDVIMRLNREQGLTVLLVEQKLPIARRVGTELRILENGRLVVSGAISALTDDVVKQHLTV